ncbi:hypothetical protein [Lutibacter sp. Hel_I_33_5]|uniref:hypothetical protein n=1 Tax=Lutibacter sp. Hel_I_33_5 TaxID=1566289 RepID=UPI00119D4D65|nr:hypothetical protein [Lutibacter sp. Hel_I_33_5]
MFATAPTSLSIIGLVPTFGITTLSVAIGIELGFQLVATSQLASVAPVQRLPAVVKSVAAP